MSKHYGYESRIDKALCLDFWLIIGRANRPSVRAVADYPSSLARNERAINLKIQLPLALFETPSISASIKVEQPAQAVTIDATAIAEAVRGVIGMDVDISVVEPGESE